MNSHCCHFEQRTSDQRTSADSVRVSATRKRSNRANEQIRFIKFLMEKGGPDVEDYYELDAWFSELAEEFRSGAYGKDDASILIAAFDDAFSNATMQGFAYNKPHGYAGDFEIIDRIYRRYYSENPRLAKWDHYWQQHAAATAVRNRASYFEQQVSGVCSSGRGGDVRVLNLASGPGRDMQWILDRCPEKKVHFDCVEQDVNAIEYAKNVCREHSEKVTFIQKNVLRFSSPIKYDLVWSAGLFDYFEDRIFVRMLKRLASLISRGGEMVIGNFSPVNPSRPHMEIFQWHLHHRSPHRLRELAESAGFERGAIRVSREITGVNLFLHLRSPL